MTSTRKSHSFTVQTSDEQTLFELELKRSREMSFRDCAVENNKRNAVKVCINKPHDNGCIPASADKKTGKRMNHQHEYKKIPFFLNLSASLYKK